MEQLKTDTRKNGSHCELPAVFSGLRATWFFAASPIKPWREAQESNTGFRATRTLRNHGFGAMEHRIIENTSETRSVSVKAT